MLDDRLISLRTLIQVKTCAPGLRKPGILAGMNREIVFVVFPDFQILDLTGPLEVFSAASRVLASRELGQVRGPSGNAGRAKPEWGSFQKATKRANLLRFFAQFTYIRQSVYGSCAFLK